MVMTFRIQWKGVSETGGKFFPKYAHSAFIRHPLVFMLSSTQRRGSHAYKLATARMPLIIQKWVKMDNA